MSECGDHKPCEHHWHDDGSSFVCCHCAKREFKQAALPPVWIPAPFTYPDPWWLRTERLPLITWSTDTISPGIDTGGNDWRVT